MEKRPIPGTNLMPSSLCLGTGDMGGTITREVAYGMLDLFIDAGGNFLDTAKVYSDWIPGEKSRSEKLIGDWVKSRKNRSQIILGTKGGHFDLDTPQIPRLSPAEVLFDLDSSLAHMQTDVIDLYWLHRDDPSRPVEEMIGTLENAVKAGKIRYYGFSNWRLDRLVSALDYSRKNKLLGFSAVQNLWNLASVNKDAIADPTIVTMDLDLWKFHRETQIAAIPFSSQANGIFQKLASGLNESISKTQLAMYINPETERRSQRVLQICQQTGLTTTQVILGYLLSQPFTTIPIFSARSEIQLKDSLTASDIHLSPDQLEFLTA